MIKTIDQTEIIIKEILAEQLGLDAEDIENDMTFTDDLNMKEEDIEDFTENLASANFELGEVDFDVTETVGELIELLAEEEEIK